MDKPTLWKIAYHEAGHAVIGHLLGSGLKRVTVEIDLSKHTQGYSIHKNLDLKKPKKMTLREIQEQARYIVGSRSILALSGILAEHIHDGEPNEIKINAGSNRDIKTLRDFMNAYQLTESQQEHLIKDFKKMTVKLLKDNWSAVQGLATALIKKGTISGKEAMKIIKMNIGQSIEKTKRR